MILSIIIPVYNEEKTIIQILEKIKKISSNLLKYEVIVIDDGSTDQSGKLLENNKHLFDKLLVNETNKGKGFSVKKGILNASGTHIIFQDADLEYDPKDFIKFFLLIEKFKPDLIIGSRIKYSEYTRSHNILNGGGGGYCPHVRNVYYEIRLSS